MKRLGPRCEHCEKCAFRADADWQTLAIARISAIHGGDAVCAHCSKTTRLRPSTEWIPIE